MFYFIVGLVVIGYLIYIGLMKVSIKPLKISCPCTFVAATAIAMVLYMTDHKALAWIVFFIGLYLLSITLLAIRKSSMQHLSTATGPANQI
jgi:tellurite resistance protein TehA-like permease